jgi:hypothetical protein
MEDELSVAAASSRVQLNIWVRAEDGAGKLVDMLLAGGLELLGPDLGPATIAMTTWNGTKQVRVKNVKSAAGGRELAAAVKRMAIPGCEPTLVCWRRGHPFYSPDSDDVWATMSSRGDGLVNLKVLLPSLMSQRVVDLVEAVADVGELISGGAWSPGERWPSWADRRWWVKPLPSPFVTGPLWLLVTPPHAHSRLAAAESARRRAIACRELSNGGALWQLSIEPTGPTGDALREWTAILEDLQLLE